MADDNRPPDERGGFGNNPDLNQRTDPLDHAMRALAPVLRGDPATTGRIIGRGEEVRKVVYEQMENLRVLRDAGQGESQQAQEITLAIEQLNELLAPAVKRIMNESPAEKYQFGAAADPRNKEGVQGVLKAVGKTKRFTEGRLEEAYSIEESKTKEAEDAVNKQKALDARMTAKGESFMEAEALKEASLPGEALRARAKYARSLVEERKNEELGPEQKKSIEDRIAKLSESLRNDLDEQYKINLELQEKMEEAMGPNGSLEDQAKIGDELGKNTNLIQEMRNILDNFSKTNANSLSNVVDNIGKFVATFALGSLAGRAFISEPYRFETAPALDMLGNQGDVGGVLSGALSTLEGYKVELNQNALNVGTGAIFTGLATKGVMGGVIGALGVGASIAGAGGFADSLWMGLPGTTDEDEIMGNQIASQMANPQRLLQNLGASSGGLLQVTGAGENLGYSRFDEDVAPGSSGNSVLDNMLLGEGGLRSYGYDANDAGAMLSGAASNLLGDRDTLTGAAEFSGRMGRAYNMDPGQVMDMMGTAQRYGSDDVVGSVAMNMGAVADEDGKISNFAANVLVPALMKVTETLSIQNLARSSKEIEEQVASLYNFMSNSDTNAGELMKSNPALFTAMISSLGEAAGLGQTDAARAAYSMYNGSSLQQIVDKDPEVTLRNTIDLMSRMGLSDRGPVESREEFYEDPLLVAAMASGNAVGINDPAMMETLITMILNNGGTYGSVLQSDDFKAIAGTGETGDGGAIDDRLQTWLGSEFSPLVSSLAEQRDALLGASVMLAEKMLEMQNSINTIIYDPQFLVKVEEGMDRLVEAVKGALGLQTEAGAESEARVAAEAATAAENMPQVYTPPTEGEGPNPTQDLLYGVLEGMDFPDFSGRDRRDNIRALDRGINSIFPDRTDLPDGVTNLSIQAVKEEILTDPNWADNYEFSSPTGGEEPPPVPDGGSQRVPNSPTSASSNNGISSFTVNMRYSVSPEQLISKMENTLDGRLRALRIA